MLRPVVVLALAALLAAPAQAAGRDRCDKDDFNSSGLHIEWGISYGHRDADTQRMLDELQLRQKGVDARSVSRTSDGCLEAQIQGPDGSWRTEYYDEDTLDLVWPK